MFLCAPQPRIPTYQQFFSIPNIPGQLGFYQMKRLYHSLSDHRTPRVRLTRIPDPSFNAFLGQVFLLDDPGPEASSLHQSPTPLSCQSLCEQENVLEPPTPQALWNNYSFPIYPRGDLFILLATPQKPKPDPPYAFKNSFWDPS